jgi:uncharacterized protein YukE
MSTQMLGGQIETMMALNGKLNEQANSVATLTATLDSQVNSTVWQGPAADRFRDVWNSQFKATLSQLQVALTEAGTEVAKRAEALQIATA